MGEWNHKSLICVYALKCKCITNKIDQICSTSELWVLQDKYLRVILRGIMVMLKPEIIVWRVKLFIKNHSIIRIWR